MKRSTFKNPLPIFAPRLFAPPLAVAGGLALGALAWGGNTPALAQPPERGTEVEAYSIPAVEAAWSRLRAEVGFREFTEPAQSIARYQEFYEEQGYKSAQTAIAITSAIAQLYWQVLDNRAKALAIYDWAIPKFGSLPRGGRLQQERDLVVANAVINRVVAAPPVALRPNDLTIAAKSELAPLKFEAPPALANVAVPAPVVLPAPGGKAMLANTPANVFGPISLPVPITFGAPATPATPIAGVRSGNQPQLTVPSVPAAVVLPSVPVLTAPAPVAATIAVPPGLTRQGAPAPLALPPGNAKANGNQPLTVVPPSAMAGAKLAAPQAVQLQTSAPSLHAPPLFDGRVATMAGLVAQWREGKMTWEEVKAQAKLTPEEAIEMLASPAIITNYSDKDLRQNLLTIAMQSPELLKDHTVLAPPVQIALAESDRSQGEAIYRELLKGEIPDGVWWNRLIVMTLLADHYAAVGAPEKAAQVKLETRQSTNAESWRGNATVEAARFFMQAGQTEKANALYKQAEKSSYGWAQGLALIDQGRALRDQDKYKEAQQVFSTPVTGLFADQIQVVLLCELGITYYDANNLELASKKFQEAIAQYQSLKNPIQGDGLERFVSRSQLYLDYIKTWDKTPFIAIPDNLRIVVRSQESLKEPLKERFVINGDYLYSIRVLSAGQPLVETITLRSYRTAPMTATTNNAHIQMHLSDVGKPEDVKSYAVKEMKIEIPPQAFAERKSLDAMITVESPSFPGFRVSIPLHVEVQN
jgi:tetratricopeptide (TPR) repeat protein